MQAFNMDLLLFSIFLLFFMKQANCYQNMIKSHIYHDILHNFNHHRQYKFKNKINSYRNNIKMVSVGPGSSSSDSSRSTSKSFIISPSIAGEVNEMLILQNFNQIQQGGRSKVGIIGSQNLHDDHMQMIELLSYALVLSGNHIYTSSGGSNGTNIAVIRYLC